MRIHLFLLIAVMLCINNAYAQNLEKVDPTIGIGCLEASLNCDIPLYHNRKSSLPFDTLRFSKIKSGKNKGKFLMNTHNSLQIKPLHYSAGNSENESIENINMGLVYFEPHLSFKVVKSKKDQYEIVLNEETFETVVIKKDENHKLYTVGKPYWESSHSSVSSSEIWFLYETWEVYLKRMESIQIKEGADLYDRINGKKMNSMMRIGIVTEVKGSWVKIKERPHYNNKVPQESYWVQWTDGRKIIVQTISAIYN